MTTGSRPNRFFPYAARMFNGAFVASLLVVGLLLTPVSCTCGGSIPHGHSLFQLPHHHHGSTDVSLDHEHYASHHGASLESTSLDLIAEPLVKDADCDGERHHEFSPSTYIALSNIAEKQDGAALKAPPSSSVGQPMSVTQPSLITLSDQNCESISLPPVRALEGTETSPETPPPKVPTLV